MLVFENKQKRFITRSIFEHLYDELKVTLWNLIDVQLNENLELDYLQVFELKIVGQKQQIIHRELFTERERKYMISLQQAKPNKATVWCLDDGVNTIMLYPANYYEGLYCVPKLQ